MYRLLNNQQNFRISLLNINFEGAINLKLVLFTQVSISVEAVLVCVNVCVTLNFLSDAWTQLTTATATNHHNPFLSASVC